jgi:hypothetical protein
MMKSGDDEETVDPEKNMLIRIAKKCLKLMSIIMMLYCIHVLTGNLLLPHSC